MFWWSRILVPRDLTLGGKNLMMVLFFVTDSGATMGQVLDSRGFCKLRCRKRKQQWQGSDKSSTEALPPWHLQCKPQNSNHPGHSPQGSRQRGSFQMWPVIWQLKTFTEIVASTLPSTMNSIQEEWSLWTQPHPSIAREMRTVNSNSGSSNLLQDPEFHAWKLQKAKNDNWCQA